MDLNTEEDWAAFLDSLENRPAPVINDTPKSSRKKSRKKRGPSPLVVILAVILALLLAALAGAAFFWAPQLLGSGDRIAHNVSANGIDLSGMTVDAAAAALNNRAGLESSSMLVILSGSAVHLSPQQTEVRLDSQAVAEAAMAFVPSPGEPSLDISLEQYLMMNEQAVREALDELIQDATTYIPSGYSRDGAVPPLQEGSIDPSSPTPHLYLNPGKAGMLADEDTILRRIRSAYLDGSFSVDVSDTLYEQEPQPLDLQAIYDAVCIQPIPAKRDPDTQEVSPASFGLVFDIAETQELLRKGEPVEIALSYASPDVSGKDFQFPDVLGFCQTPHSDNEKRNENLRLACAALNGVVLQPGDVLSYNDTLGERTEERGYRKAPAYSGVDLVDSLGGGICQVSSTLYLCSLYAELETVERTNHGFPANYIPMGLDATVSWGSPDLKIRNNSDRPVKLLADVQDGFVCVWIMGTETRDYYVRIGFGSSDRFAKSSVRKYDRETNQQLSNEDLVYSSYLSEVESMVGEIGPEQIYRYGMARDTEVHEPLPETLEAAKRNIAPNAYQ